MDNGSKADRQYWASAVGCWARAKTIREAFRLCKSHYYLKEPAKHSIFIYRLPDWADEVQFSEWDGSFRVTAPEELLPADTPYDQQVEWYGKPGNKAVKVGEWKVRTPIKDVPEFED